MAFNILQTAFEKLKECLGVELRQLINKHRVWTVFGLCSSGAALYLAWFLKRPKGLPPGPLGYPVLGCLPHFAEASSGFKDLTARYGDIFTLWTGGNNYILILNSYEAIKEVYLKSGNVFMDRDSESLGGVFKVEGTIFNAHYDDTYKESRKVTIQAMRTLISTKLGKILDSELMEMETVIDQSSGQAIDLSHHIKTVLTKSMAQLLFSKTCSTEEADDLVEKLWQWNECSGKAFFSVFIPWYLTYFMLSKELQLGRQITRDIIQIIRECADNHVTKAEGDPINDVLDAYLQGSNLDKFPREKVIGTLFTFLPDSSYTSSIMVQWLMVYLAKYQEAQQKIFQEIQEICNDGTDLNKRSFMPVTESFIMEVFRIVTPFTFALPNKPLSCAPLRGYNVPTNTSIMSHIEVVHKDPTLFPDPEQFKPGRFIKDGKIGNTQGFMPFGLGRRMCVGEQLVRNNMFYIVTKLVRKYKITPPEGLTISLDYTNAEFVKMPKVFNLCFLRR